MKRRSCISFGFLLALSLFGTSLGLQAERVRSTAYLTTEGGKVYVVAEHRTELLKRPLALTSELTITTNGVIKISGDGEEQLREGRAITLDGFWIGDDGTLLAFQPHYLMKDRVLYSVKSGVKAVLEQDVAFANGNVLRTDGTLLTSDYRVIRLQDGQRLAFTGETIPALDHVMIKDGSLVLQKDGSIIPLPVVSRIGMSDGTVVSGAGLITLPTGEQITLAEGQRVTLDGAAMSRIQ